MLLITINRMKSHYQIDNSLLDSINALLTHKCLPTIITILTPKYKIYDT